MISQVLNEHRRRLARLAERRGVAQLKHLYDRARAELESKLARASRGVDTFTVHQLRVFSAEIRQGQMLLAKHMTGELGDISLEAQTEALRGLSRDITRLEKHYSGADITLPIDEAARFQGVINGRRESLLRAHETSMARYTANVVTEMEDQLSLSLVEGEAPSATIARVMDASETTWYQAECIARTETAFAFNAASADGMRELAVDLGDLMMRWVEYVSDDGQPLDKRVGEDSIAMHGQVVKPGENFVFPHTMPDGSAVPDELEHFIGESWAFPPNRPNDRSTISPWRAHWGIPAWQWRNGQRVDVE